MWVFLSGAYTHVSDRAHTARAAPLWHHANLEAVGWICLGDQLRQLQPPRGGEVAHQLRHREKDLMARATLSKPH